MIIRQYHEFPSRAQGKERETARGEMILMCRRVHKNGPEHEGSIEDAHAAGTRAIRAFTARNVAHVKSVDGGEHLATRVIA